ncbi:MAG: TSUP family transporter [Candidatus Neoclostridium sp.]
MTIKLVICFIISVFGAFAGAACGIGGGVIIKPLLDLISVTSVEAANFLSSATILSMSAYSVIRASRDKSTTLDFKISTPLAVGAAVGGVSGSLLFKLVKVSFESQKTVVAVQATVLMVIMLVIAIIYTFFKEKLPTLRITNKALCLLIGMCLGVVSSFLGIGGGPINIIVLYFFFSMDAKRASLNSIYIILFSQTANIIATLISGAPYFEWYLLVLMMAGGISGGIIGRTVSKKLSVRAADGLFKAFLWLIIVICAYNSVRYALF